MSEITIIKIDQHSATADQIDVWSFEQWRRAIEESGEGMVPKLTGGDAEAAQAIHGGSYEVKDVTESESPSWGSVWFREGDDGGMEQYKTNFATK